jgi:putative transposase
MTDNEINYYHVYNRGVEKRAIFQDIQDYNVFLNYLKEYLSPKNETDLRKTLADPLDLNQRDKVWKSIRVRNYHKDLELLAYCLMPNHFHFFIKQNTMLTIDKFIHALCTRYVMYFNAKYKRVGPLFQGRYKSVLVTDEGQYLHLSRYIHKQALVLQGPALQISQPSSYSEYIGERSTSWVHPESVLGSFSKNERAFSYQNFILDAMRGPASQMDEEEI